jgi:cytochrome o ubiquinol oxidase subunit 1
MTTMGAVLVMASLFVGEFARTGWLAFPPLSGILASPGVGVDYYIWALQIAGVGTLLSGVNLIVTIVKMRAPGMDLMKMPVFTWTWLCWAWTACSTPTSSRTTRAATPCCT